MNSAGRCWKHLSAFTKIFSGSFGNGLSCPRRGPNKLVTGFNHTACAEETRVQAVVKRQVTRTGIRPSQGKVTDPLITRHGALCFSGCKLQSFGHD